MININTKSVIQKKIKIERKNSRELNAIKIRQEVPRQAKKSPGKIYSTNQNCVIHCYFLHK
jgi:hypothetical protein